MLTRPLRASIVRLTALLALAGAPLAADAKPAAAPTPAANSAATPAADAAAKPVRNTSKWNLEKSSRLAISGYDPVAYFPEGGGKPLAGDAKLTTTVDGVTYRFASGAHRDLFVANPARYQPSYGGWCAWAMLDGEQVEVDPKSFIVKNDRLYLFYDGFLADTRSKWLKGDHTAESAKADGSWKKISGESAVMVAAKPLASAAGTLKSQLETITTNVAAKVGPETAAKFEKSIEEVRSATKDTRRLAVGDMLPELTLPDATGNPRSLNSMLAAGPMVVTFYRGGWCPYCNTQLQAYQQMLPELLQAGAQLVAISPQSPDASLSTAEKNKLEFPVLSDATSAAAKAFGIAFTPPPSVAAMYRPLLEKSNAPGNDQLPMAATYVIDSTGRITYASVSADYRQRAEPAEVLAAVKAISPSK
jgi:peroxiredoxin/YHS domain-containing protein